MRKSYFRLLEGVLFSLPLLFASCGNGDNALEEIINGGGSEGGGSSAINATAITLKQTMKVLVKGGDALTITATATPAEATLTWESSDKAVATVENGVVTPVGAGIATITAKSGDVTATCEVFVGNEVSISSSAYEAKNYDILKGNMGANSLTIPDGIKVAFNGITTTGQIICSGTATIILADGSENTVTVSTYDKAGIKIGGTGTTLTINGETAGTGKLTAQGGDSAAGIGTDDADPGSGDIEGGNITISGGTVTATGGDGGAGIGTGQTDLSYKNTCGNITINGGTVIATGGEKAAGIGTGEIGNDGCSTCGAITITADVTKVTATMGSGGTGTNSIGRGEEYDGTQTCGTITFGTAEVYDGGGDWTTYNSMTAGTYGGLTLAISTTTESNDTWTLTPAE